MRARRPRVVFVAVVAVTILAVTGSSSGATGGFAHLTPGQPSKLTATQIRRLSAGVANRSIIVFRNQLASLPAGGRTAALRAHAADAAQAPVLAELRAVHATHVAGFHIVNAIAATISGAEARRLRANPAIRAVVPDAVRKFAPLTDGPGAGGAQPAGSTGAASTGRGAHTASAQQICPSDPSQPLLEPEAREVMNADAANQIADGTGVRVGIIADGIDPNNPDLIRAAHSVVFDYQDFSGFGTGSPSDGREAFLDATSIAAQGNQTYDLSGFVNPAHPLPPGCNIRIGGLAPGASLAVLNVAGPNPGFFDSTIVQAIQYAVTVDHVDVLNESFGGLPIPDTQDDPVSLADQAAVAAGVTVVVSSGDSGPTNTIGSPASQPGVISVGGTTTFRVYRQTTRYGTQLSPGGWENNNITALSSAGTTEFGPGSVNVVAPGDRGWSLCSSDLTQFFGCADIDHGTNPPPIWAAGGTSASAPETSAVAADVIEAYRHTHSGATPSPDLVKRIIVGTATDLGAPADHQGAGLVNALKAVQLAESIHDANGPGTPTGQTLLISKPRMSADAKPGNSHSFVMKVTNESAAPQTVHPTVTGDPTTMSTDTGAVTLSSASPTYIDGEGRTDFYAIHTFGVPAGANSLNGDIAWNDQSIGGVAFETLFDPSGNVAAYTLLGSAQSGRGHVEVRAPMAGTWTAVIFTVSNAPYFGPVQFAFTTQQFHSVGTTSPASVTIQPGRSSKLHVTLTAGSPGDRSYDLHLGTGQADDGSVPILFRSVVRTDSRGATFTGTLTGGGVTGNAGQTETFPFAVPNFKPSMNVHVALTDPNSPVRAFLIDPHGEPVDVATTATFDTSGIQTGFGKDIELSHTTPEGGEWTLVLLVFGPIDGSHLSEPFTTTISFTAPQVTETGLPNASATILPAGSPATATITVTNTSSVRKFYFADPRLNTVATQLLAPFGQVNGVPLPLSLTSQPVWLVPTHSQNLTVAAQGTIPITMDVTASNGDPDVLAAATGTNAVAATRSDPELAPGFWFGLPEPMGPFGVTGVTGSVDLGATALTNRFDPAVASSAGDIWLAALNPATPSSPLVLDPGQSGQITVTITPAGSAGTHVTGFVDVDTFNIDTISGDQVISFPYEYTVG